MDPKHDPIADLVAEYQEKVLAQLFGFLCDTQPRHFTTSTQPTTHTTKNEKETPDRHN